MGSIVSHAFLFVIYMTRL